MKEDKLKKLRQKAEEILKQKDSEKSAEYINDVEKIIEELNVFQIELEMQNNELQSTNRKLIAEQEKYHDLYQNAPIAYFTINETGNIYDLNNIAAEMLYLPIYALNKTSIFPYLEESSKSIFNQFFKKVFNSIKVEQTEINFIDSNNQIVNAKVNAQAYFDYKLKSKLCCCAVTDITRQKKHEKIITDQNELLTLAFDNEKVAWWDWNYKTGNVRFSPNKATMLGYTVEEFPTNVYKITELIHPDDYHEAMEAMQKHLTGKTSIYEVIYRIKTKQKNYEYYYDFGKIIERDANQKPTRINGIVFNISKQKEFEINFKKAKETAELNHQRFGNLFNYSNDGIRIVNTDGVIIDVNQRMCEISGYAPENIIGNYIWDIIYRHTPTYKQSSEVYQRIKSICEGALKTGKFTFEKQTNEMVLQSANGDLKNVEAHYFVVPENNGFLLYSIIRDVTDYKKSQKELIVAKEKAEESDKLKTAFLNNISHEIRTPLNAISGFSQIITKQNQASDKLKKFSDIITINSNKLIEIINDVIEVSQLHAHQMTIKNDLFDFIHLINEIINEYKDQIKNNGLDFKVNINPNLKNFNILSDKPKLSKIIKHLIDNALKFTHKGSIILDFQLSNEKLEFSIADTGIGISKEMQEIIFEPFRQVEIGESRNYGGNGIGLALAKGFVQLLNGTIKLQSEFNVGTTIFVSIPIQKISNNDELKKPELKSTKKADTILIVEDEYSNYLYLAELIQEFCPHILYASNGQQAIEICRTEKQIDIALMDIKMPIMDGHTATKLIKAFRPDLPIIAQTAYATDNDKEKFLESGFDDFICKPIQEETLFAALDKYINR